MTLLLVLLALIAGGLLGVELATFPPAPSGQVKAIGAQEPKIVSAGQIPAPLPPGQ